MVHPWSNLEIAVGLWLSVTSPLHRPAAYVCGGLGGGHLMQMNLVGRSAGPGEGI